MNLNDLIYRNLSPKPWDEAENLPWNEPGFSARILLEHLDQSHDHASRRFESIDRHVEWIHQVLLDDDAVPVLDLCCGPGLYTSRLAKYGHTCTGIDFSPASIEYARQMTQPDQGRCSYRLDDIRTADYGTGYGLVMLIFGEFNVFRPEDARKIVEKSYQALKPGGLLLMEVSTCDKIYDMGQNPPLWYSAPAGLFSDRPHLCLTESFYYPDQGVAITRYYIVDSQTGTVNLYSCSYQGYTHSDLEALLEGAGFENIRFFNSLDPRQEESNGGEFLVVVCQRPLRAENV